MRVLLLASLSCAAFPRVAEAQQRAAADVLFQEGRKAMDAGDYAAACRKFEESNRLDPAVGTVFNLANCEEKRGRLATSWEAFRQVAERLPESDNRRAIAEQRIAAIEPRLPYLTIRLREGGPEATQVLRDGVEFGSASLNLAIPADPGDHEIIVKAAGYEDRAFRVTLAEGERKELVVEPGAKAAASAEPTQTAPVPADVTADSGQTEPEAAVGPAPGRFGVFARADLDGKMRGAVFAPGLVVDVTAQIELGVAALIGENKGFEPAAAFYILSGSFQPRVTLAAPVFFVDGARAGVRAAAGLEWEMTPNLGLFLDVGVAYHPSVPKEYENFTFVPSAGAVARL